MQNPIFKSPQDFTFFTVKKQGKILGRIVAMIHPASQEKFKWKRAQFGYFDCVDDLEVAQGLLNAAEKFARDHGSTEIAGNFNLTANQAIGVVTKIIKNYHYTDQVFAPIYVSKLLEQAGYQKFFPMHTFEAEVAKLNVDALLGPKQKDILANPDFTFRKLQKNKFDEVIEAMRLCLNDGFQDNPMAVALTQEEIRFQAKDLMLVVDEELSTMAFFKGRPVGTLICIPDLNPLLKNIRSKLGLTTPYYFLKHKMNRDGAVGIFYSVAKDFHSRGLNTLMMCQISKALQSRGYKRLGGTWIADENIASLKQAEKLGMKPMHELHLYRKSLL